ncbi:MAG: hypothetical protein HND56_09920 [Pseudomonadota bacterium]|jgi:hypothetical protein|nr:hypothetical protein [Pseudomonadota bacterium]QKK05987.1 MAG: hypothetical protein HND56_09920 [Pseudomonadota bacterium]
MGLVKFAVQQIAMAAITRVSRTAGDEIGKAVVKEGSKKIAEKVVQRGEDGNITIPTSLGGVLDMVKKGKGKGKTVVTSHGEVEVPEVKQAPVDISGGSTNTVDKLAKTAEEFGTVAKTQVDGATEKGKKLFGGLLENAKKVGNAAAKGYSKDK